MILDRATLVGAKSGRSRTIGVPYNSFLSKVVHEYRLLLLFLLLLLCWQTRQSSGGRRRVNGIGRATVVMQRSGRERRVVRAAIDIES
jgi:hypothetical protein